MTARRLVLLGLILGALLPLKIAHMPGAGPYGLDASYYFQIARHVAEGEGLLTSVSLYHEGLNPLPAPARIYPLWPLLLGATGAAMGMTAAANVLPAALYFLNLLLLYALANRVAVRMRGTPILTTGAVPIDAGHVLVLIWATNRMFMSSTSHPYTEGLAFALAFGSMIAVDKPSFAGAGTAGVLAGLSFLARSQMLIVPAATLPLLACAALRSRAVRPLVAYAVGVAAAVSPWFVYRASVAPSRTDIGRFVTWVDSGSLSSYVTDRLPGVLIAFDPRSALSYFQSFGAVAALVPLAVVVAAAGWRQMRPLWPRLCSDSTLIVVASVGIAVASHAILLHRHAQFFLPWLFGWRHGLPFIFAVVVAVAYLLTHPVAVLRIGVATIIFLAVTTSAVQLIRAAGHAGTRAQPAEEELIAWTESLATPPTILTTHAQQLAMLTRARYHWTTCSEPADQTRTMLSRLPIDYVVVYENETGCAFIGGAASEFTLVHAFGPPGQRIFALRPRRAGP